MILNAHEMSMIRYAVDRVARDEVGLHVQQARLLRERFTVVEPPKGVTLHRDTRVHSQKALETLCAHAHHGFKYGHFTGEFSMDGGTYKFETYTDKECIEVDYHNGHSWKDVPRVKFAFHPWPQHGVVCVE